MCRKRASEEVLEDKEGIRIQWSEKLEALPYCFTPPPSSLQLLLLYRCSDHSRIGRPKQGKKESKQARKISWKRRSKFFYKRNPHKVRRLLRLQ
ncbi:hypothetical protein IEQ34_010532 [Dendrobium chrysotoxum]|uniref:Uncharacterized protein n=1 Tax=Dendrobium chrysotoxum TaxID=161865 RepID=A0AAV7GDL1_DENCH|nr:hypothetical protein IEQ34_010532 [Dendrobium chrysotoxum]